MCCQTVTLVDCSLLNFVGSRGLATRPTTEHRLTNSRQDHVRGQLSSSSLLAACCCKNASRVQAGYTNRLLELSQREVRGALTIRFTERTLPCLAGSARRQQAARWRIAGHKHWAAARDAREHDMLFLGAAVILVRRRCSSGPVTVHAPSFLETPGLNLKNLT